MPVTYMLVTRPAVIPTAVIRIRTVHMTTTLMTTDITTTTRTAAAPIVRPRNPCGRGAWLQWGSREASYQLPALLWCC